MLQKKKLGNGMWNPEITLKYHVVLERWYKYYGMSLSGRIKVE
jgi:hypothetical protein